MYALLGKPQNIEEDEDFKTTIYSGLTRALGLNQGDQFSIETDQRYRYVMLLLDHVVYAQLSNLSFLISFSLVFGFHYLACSNCSGSRWIPY